MRYCYYSLLVILVCVQNTQANPYSALIASDGVAVRSGPGLEFYPVLQLHAGDQVEVHYEQGEWCAIRPPIGSFSWVSANHIEYNAGNVGTVLVDGLAARIGSEHSDDCETVQVTLKKGEAVLILERRETPENPNSPIWLKIAPPRGEFRWIHRSALNTPAGSIQQVQHRVQRRQPTGQTIPFPAVSQSNGEPVSSALATIESAPRVAALQRNVPHLSGNVPADPFQRAFNELQREAYIVMTRPTNDEVFAVLIERAEELHHISPTDVDLEKTYHLLESLHRTRLVRRELALRRPANLAVNHTASQNVAPLLPRANALPNAGAPMPQGQPVQSQSVIPAYTPTAAQGPALPTRSGVNVGGFDIVGRLGEFDPLPDGHPPFAVVDERDQIICLISPSPDLDLSQFVGQFVGINGILGFYERHQGGPLSRHITARSVQALR
ncbi:MAG: SH3 domain-containing protein [Planctomycetaceae bacterium]|nr:SH3 domain-containing protein [Planctomycetaceae bacterium]